MGETGRSGAAAGGDGRGRISTPWRWCPAPNFYFLTGANFHLMERPTLLVVPREGPLHAVMPLLERSRWQAARARGGDELLAGLRRLRRRLRRAGRAGSRRRRIGVEGQRMRVFEAEALRARLPGRGRSSTRMRPSRACACTRTRARSRRCAGRSRSARAALAATLAARRGRHERDRVPRGVSWPRCSPPAPTGWRSTRSCSPAPPPPTRTAAPSPERRLERGQPLLIDFGAAWGGYMADITRTFFVGSAAPEHRDIYEAVRAANELGREHRRAADDARHARPPRHRQPARLGLRRSGADQDRPRPRARRARGAAGDGRQHAGDGARHGLHHRARPLPRRATSACASRTTCW